jgi:hypothetical protein
MTVGRALDAAVVVVVAVAATYRPLWGSTTPEPSLSDDALRARGADAGIAVDVVVIRSLLIELAGSIDERTIEEPWFMWTVLLLSLEAKGVFVLALLAIPPLLLIEARSGWC